jgi:hypothetical protein
VIQSSAPSRKPAHALAHRRAAGADDHAQRRQPLADLLEVRPSRGTQSARSDHEHVQPHRDERVDRHGLARTRCCSPRRGRAGWRGPAEPRVRIEDAETHGGLAGVEAMLDGEYVDRATRLLRRGTHNTWLQLSTAHAANSARSASREITFGSVRCTREIGRGPVAASLHRRDARKRSSLARFPPLLTRRPWRSRAAGRRVASPSAGEPPASARRPARPSGALLDRPQAAPVSRRRAEGEPPARRA